MQGQKKEKKRSKKLVLVMVLAIFVLIGLTGGVLIKTVYYDKFGDGVMANQEANRLITYLGLNEYKYTEKIGSAFTYADARILLDCAEVSYEEVGVAVRGIPGFIPLTKKQFETIYTSLIEQLELTRLSSGSLYIFDIDSSNEKEIGGVIYEVIGTSNGDYYMEKDYGMDHSFIGKVVSVYVSNNEIILCQGESSDTVSVKNAYAVKVTEEEDGEYLISYVNGTMEKLPLANNAEIPEKLDGCLCDISLSNKGVLGLTDYTDELVEAKVTSYSNGAITVEGYDMPQYLSEVFNVYKVKGSFKATQTAGTLIGYDKVSLYLKDGYVEAALITEDIHTKDIRVVLRTNDGTGYYHNSVLITSDTDFTITYGNQVRECTAKEKIEIRTGSEELQSGPAYVTSKEEDGKITIASLTKQSGNPSYRGTIELSKDDKGVLVVNELPVEEYLYGVLPSEMPASYEREALKAQAICARAYAYRQMESDVYAKYGAHLDDSIYSQVYNNVGEDERTNYAVDDTYGVVPCYNNEVIEAFFFSTSCGTTSNNSVVWGGNQKPYLLDTMETEYNDLASLSNEASFKSFIDGDVGTGFIEEDEPFYRWSVGFTKNRLTDAINKHLYERIQAMPEYILVMNALGGYEKKAINTIGELVSIEINKRGDSGIIEEMVIKGTEETILVRGQANARAILCPEEVTIRKQDGSTLKGWTSLPSAYYYIDDTNGFVIRGGGFGHGVGMSQNGANCMAQMGYTASDILLHYYTAVELKDMYELMGE